MVLLSLSMSVLMLMFASMWARPLWLVSGFESASVWVTMWWFLWVLVLPSR
jgi:hypothetical protein